jgi:hypothetical protein
MTKEIITRLVVSNIVAIPSAILVNMPDWIDGTHKLTVESIEWKLVLNRVRSRKPRRNVKQVASKVRSVLAR